MVVQVVELAVVVGAGWRAEVQVRAAKELGLDLAGTATGLLAVCLERKGRFQATPQYCTCTSSTEILAKYCRLWYSLVIC